ncbi:hypothetical protein FB567DRAFT_588797 [Paraphoma chrysanthemicola]|uniref:Uncharacterized protein n=1 Tax=Paraphoma chrysanthemicola TaxID=798071 RepID=A0A8K0W2U1_9PLEO|nr:hypothetical protein FB567DRAFT_588797 [Paraphoma chrysanthemicola]
MALSQENMWTQTAQTDSVVGTGSNVRSVHDGNLEAPKNQKRKPRKSRKTKKARDSNEEPSLETEIDTVKPAQPVESRDKGVYRVHNKAALQPYRKYKTIYGELKYQQPVTKPQTISFMEIPTEIRLMIFQHHFVSDKPIEMWAETGDVYADQKVRRQAKGAFKRKFWHKRIVNFGLLRTCKQINVEVGEIFYCENEFQFSGTNGHMIAYAYLKKIGPRNINFLQSITSAAPRQSDDRGMYGENWNPKTWMRINEVYDRAPFPSLSNTPRNRWFYKRLDFVASWCALAWMLTTAHRLKSVNIVVPQPTKDTFYFYAYLVTGPTLSAFDDLAAARPELEFHVVQVIEPNQEVLDTAKPLLGILRPLVVCHVDVAEFDQDRLGRWSIKD